LRRFPKRPASTPKSGAASRHFECATRTICSRTSRSRHCRSNSTRKKSRRLLLVAMLQISPGTAWPPRPGVGDVALAVFSARMPQGQGTGSYELRRGGAGKPCSNRAFSGPYGMGTELWFIFGLLSDADFEMVQGWLNESGVVRWCEGEDLSMPGPLQPCGPLPAASIGVGRAPRAVEALAGPDYRSYVHGTRGPGLREDASLVTPRRRGLEPGRLLRRRPNALTWGGRPRSLVIRGRHPGTHAIRMPRRRG
jgi:hypothetical protein